MNTRGDTGSGITGPLSAAGSAVPLAWRGRLWGLTAAALVWLLAIWALPGSFDRLNEAGTDLVWRLTASNAPERRVVLVDIDDASLAQIGPWPWPRPVVSQLVRQLDQYGAGLKLFDVVFPDPREGSDTLAAALKASPAQSPNLLAQIFALRNESTLQIGQPSGALAGQGCLPPSVPAQGVIANAPGLGAAAGHITPLLDADGAVRRVPALVCYHDQTYPALALAGVMSQMQGTALSVVPGQGRWQAPWQLQWPDKAQAAIGLDELGNLRVPYGHSRESFISLSAADVLNHRVPAELLQGAWVVVGASAFGLADTVPTPLGGAVSGAEVHLQLLSGIIDGAVPYTPHAAAWLQTLYAVLAVGLLVALAHRQSLHGGRVVVLLPLVTAGAALAGFVLHAALLLHANWWLGWAQPTVAILLAGGALSTHTHARTLWEKRRVYQNLASYVPGPVAEKIALTVPSGDIQAQRLDVTVLAADVRNFSAYCEARSPEDSARVLHRFYAHASEIVAAHGGVVEEMVGDSLLAVFNGALPCTDHAAQALAAAMAIWQQCSEELPNTLSQGLEPLSLSLGVETGVALVGSFGAAGRRVHTVLGQTVTVALRLRDLTADLAYPILVGPGTEQGVAPRIDAPHMALKSLGVFLLPGLRHTSKIFTLRHLLQPGGTAEQQVLHYLNQQQNTA